MCDKILKIVVRANNITLLAPNPRLLTNAERQKRPRRRPGGSTDYGAATDYKQTGTFSLLLSKARRQRNFNLKIFCHLKTKN